MNNTKEHVSEYLSQKFKVLSFIAIIAVVFSHAYNYTDTHLQPMTRITEGRHVPAMLEFCISNALMRFCVPVFFLISGFLFFAGLQEFKASDYFKKIKRRIISLLVPYLFWVLLWTFIGLLLVNLFSDAGFPQLQGTFAGEEYSVIKLMYLKPIPFQFWFIRDLLKLVLISPLFYLLARELKEYSILLFVIPWLIDMHFTVLPRSDSMLFFAIGVCMAVCDNDCLHLKRPYKSKVALLFPVCWILSCIGYTYLCATTDDRMLPDIFLTITYNICVALGVVSIFVLYDFLSGKAQKQGNSSVLSSSFIIFAIHEPLQHFIFQYVFLEERSDAVHIILYFGLPILLTLICIMINIFLSRFAPRLRVFLTGGR